MSERRAPYHAGPEPATVKIRLVGTLADVDSTLANLRRFFTVLNVSKDYPDLGEIRRYVTIAAPGKEISQ